MPSSISIGPIKLRAEAERLRADFDPVHERMLEATRNGGPPDELRAEWERLGREVLAVLDVLEPTDPDAIPELAGPF